MREIKPDSTRRERLSLAAAAALLAGACDTQAAPPPPALHPPAEHPPAGHPQPEPLANECIQTPQKARPAECGARQRPEWDTDTLRLPWRVVAADRDADGDSELIIGHGGDFGPQWIIGFDGLADRGLSPKIHWVSQEPLFTSSLRAADILYHDGVEVLAASYYGALKPPNSGNRGSGIRLYRQPPLGGSYTTQWVVPGEVILPCAQIYDFQLVDIDLDGDLDIIAAIKSINIETCPDTEQHSPFPELFSPISEACLIESYLPPSKLLEKHLLFGPLTTPQGVDLAVIEHKDKDFDRIAKSVSYPGRILSESSSTSAVASRASSVLAPTPTSSSSQPAGLHAKDPAPGPSAACSTRPSRLPRTKPPANLSVEKPILAIFKNAGTHRIPRFGVFPDWFSYISHEAQRATALELFDFDQDGHLDIIVGIEQHPTHVLFGGVSGPRAESGGYLTMMAPSEALALSAGDDLASLSLAAALLHTADDGQARVYLAEARSCHTPNDSPCTSPPHAVIHSPSEQPIDIKWPSNRTLQALSVLLTESRSGEPLLLLGRGDRRPGFPELAPHTVDAFDIHTGKSTPYTLVEAELSALHMTTLPSYDNAEPLTHRGHVRGAALTLPGVGPMKVQSVSMGETAVPACGPSAGKPCYWSVGPSTLLFVGCPPDAAVQVRYQRPTSRGVAVADSRLSKHAVIGWQVPL